MQDKKKLYPLVKKEAKALRAHLTQKEKDKLDFKFLDPDCPYTCVYGQATGDCYSKRAVDLIKKHCTKVYKVVTEEKILTNAVLNGTPIGKKRTHTTVEFFSPIEIMIFQKGQKRNTKKLIQYIKGEIKELTLS